MYDFLQKQFLENTVQLYLEVFAAIFIAFIIKRFISKYFAALLFRSFTKAGKRFYKQSFIQLISQPLGNFIFLFITVISLSKLIFPGFLDIEIYKTTTHKVVEALGKIALIVSFILLCIRMVQYAALILQEKANKTDVQANNQLIIFFKDFFRVVLIFIGILLILKLAFNYNVGNLVTGLSIIGAAIALATKENLENLIASFIIFFDKPFATGDLVKVQGFNGTVEKIGLRSTRIRTDQKTFITVPNKQMVDTILDNISMRTQRKAELKLEIALTATQEQLRKVIPAIKMVLHKDIIENNAVFLSDTGRNAHIITVEYFTSMQQTITEFNALREDVNLEIIGLLSKNHISLAGADTKVVVTQKKE